MTSRFFPPPIQADGSSGPDLSSPHSSGFHSSGSHSSGSRCPVDPNSVDALTGLGDRRWLQTRLADHIQAQRPFSLTLCDLRKFAYYNYRWGFNQGDQVLQNLAQRLAARLPQAAELFRCGGDEFAIVMPRQGLQGRTTYQFLQRIHRTTTALNQEDQGWQPLEPLSLCLGLAHFPQHGQQAEELLTAADQALGLTQLLCPGYFTVYHPLGHSFLQSMRSFH